MGLPGLRWAQRSRVIDWFVLGFAVLGTLLAFVATFANYRDDVWRLREGKYSVVEGPVSDFAELPSRGETFVVDGRRFTYYAIDAIAGFHNLASEGGPIHEQICVQIAYFGSEILRLEITQCRQ